MADNAPLSVSRPPFPNLVIGFNRRVECHIATIATGATPSVVQTMSTAGITVTDTAQGRITVGFPAGGTGAIGWVVNSTPSLATPDAALDYSIDSDLTNFATGSLELSVFADDANTTADDVTGQVTLMIYVVKAA